MGNIGLYRYSTSPHKPPGGGGALPPLQWVKMKSNQRYSYFISPTNTKNFLYCPVLITVFGKNLLDFFR